ncbi:MAG: signal peptidase I [Sarcina sp.]|nr:signal peptidase I [Sarcina sp.]
MRTKDMMQEDRILEKYNAYKLEWLHDSMHFIMLIAVLFVVFRFVIGLSAVSGDSMEPQLSGGDLVVYYRLEKSYRQGDVVSIRVPSGDYYVKRIAAVGGDIVDLRDGKVYVNGGELKDSMSHGQTLEEAGGVIYPYKVRRGNVFVLGDNRMASLDSRTFGEVNLRQIKGKILLRIGPAGIGPVGDGTTGRQEP